MVSTCESEKEVVRHSSAALFKHGRGVSAELQRILAVSLRRVELVIEVQKCLSYQVVFIVS